MTEEKPMKVDEFKTGGFIFESIVFEAEHMEEELIELKKLWPPPLLTLATGKLQRLYDKL